MNFGCPASEKGSRQAVPQNDGLTVAVGSGWAGAALFGLAMILQVPVGYQDETGFHCGVPEIEVSSVALERENAFFDSDLI